MQWHSCPLDTMLVFSAVTLQESKQEITEVSSFVVSGEKSTRYIQSSCSFWDIDHEIFAMVILSLLLIQEGQVSVTCRPRKKCN